MTFATEKSPFMKNLQKIGLLLTILFSFCGSALSQSWQPLLHPAPFQASVPLLLTDGTLLVQVVGASNWWKLTPDINGSYRNGTWAQVASLPSTYGPLYYASAVLADGRVVIVGGEYNNFSAVWTNQGASYDPITNAWTMLAPPTGWSNIGDAQCVVMPDGKFLVANPFDTRMASLNPATMTWTPLNGAGKVDRFDEEGWTLMPDSTLMTVDAIQNPHTEKYIPWLDIWVSAGNTPQTLVDSASQEMGPSVLLPNGKMVAFGATGHNAIYTVGALSTDPGSWASIPDFPMVSGQQLAMADAPSCLLTNGNVLVGASPGIFNPGTKFFEYDGVSLIPEPATPNSPGNPCYVGNMLMLPTGEVFYTDFTNDIRMYIPIGGPNPAWKPTITSCPSVLSPNQVFTIQGTQFNGLSQCCSYGDDSANATNYPLVRVTNNATGHVKYCRTKDHSTMAVATGSLPTSTSVTVPSNIETGASTIEVVTNGIASTPLAITVGTPAPVITSVSPSSITAGGATFTMTVTGTGYVSSSFLSWKSASIGGASFSVFPVTTFVSPTQLSVVIPAALFTKVGKYSVTVVNPGNIKSNAVQVTAN